MQEKLVLPKLHRRIFIDGYDCNQVTIYASFYVEAANRDMFMATRQRFFVAFAAACHRHGAHLASNRREVLCHNTVACF